MTQRRATMQQVAASAGVSLKTVSRVVNRESGVSAHLIDRVESAVERLGYRHNLAASQLRRGLRTASIGVLLQDLGNDFCAAVLRGVEQRARDLGLVVISASLDEEPEREKELVVGLVERRIDGLVLMAASSDQGYLAEEIAAGLVAVAVDRLPQGQTMDSVTTDNVGGSRSAVQHLLRHGHRRIAFVGDDLDIRTAADRLEGYRTALADAGIEISPELERPGRGTAEAARLAVAGLLALAQPPTAIFTARNDTTVGAVRALREAGRQHEVALVGFDDFFTADLLDPAVTVVSQDAEAQGRGAVDLMQDRLSGLRGPGRQLVLATRLIPRGSGEIPPNFSQASTPETAS